MFIFLLIPAILSIVTPILVSNTITAITVYDYSRAIKQTTIEFIILLISTISYFCYYLVNKKITKQIIFNYQTFIYNNVRQNKNISNINLSTLKDISLCVSFNKNLIFKLCFFIKSIIILIIIYNYNYILSLVLVLVSIISYFLLNKSDQKIKYYNQQLSVYEQKSLNLFNSICKGELVEQSYNIESALKDKYFSYVNENTKLTNKISFFYNLNNNFITLILKITVFASSIYLIGLVKSTTLTLSTFLILTPYLTSSAENLISFLDIFSEIALIDNALNNFKSLEYQSSSTQNNSPIEISNYNIYFYQLSAKQNNQTCLNNFNETLKHKTLNLFLGDNFSCKGILFSLLNRSLTPSNGSIFIDGKNISDIPTESYKKIIAFTSSNDYFFDISIYENLFLVCNNRKEILKTINEFKLKNLIDNQPQKINTIVSEQSDVVLKFFLGITRAYLSGAKVICIYGLPNNLNQNHLKLLENILLKIKEKCTINLFLDKSMLNLKFDNIFNCEESLIKRKRTMNNLSNNADNNIRK